MISITIAWRKFHSVKIVSAFLLLTAFTMMAVFLLPDNVEEDHVAHVTVTGYKYHRDGIAHVVTNGEKTYDMFLDDPARLSVGYTCSDTFRVTVPGEERNFIKRDERLTMKMNGLDGRIYHDSIDQDDCVPAEKTFGMHLSAMRDKYINRILSRSEYDYAFDILTLSIGNKSYITPDFFDALQKLGIYHLYVISGTHVAFVSGILFFVLKRMRFTINMIKVIMIICLLLFLMLNFFSPSVLRAVLMAIMLITTSFFRAKPYLTVISVTAIIQVLYNPLVMYHAGFQLSYITTCLIILSRPYWQAKAPSVQLMAVTAIAEVSTLTVVLQQFNEVSVSGLVMNFIFVPLFSFLIFPMVIIYNFMAFTVFPAFADEIYHFVFTGLKEFILFLSNLFKHRFSVQSPNAVGLIMLIFLSYMIMREICLGNFKRICVYTALFIFIIIILDRVSWYDYTITMVDVGQGDAFIVEDHRNNKTVLIDTGGKFYPEENRFPLSEKTVLPYLKESGIDRLDMMVLSHMDLDHTGEALHILQNRQVDHIYVNPGDPAFQEWYHTEGIGDYEGDFVNAMEIKEVNIGGIRMKKLFPEENPGGDDSNQHSIVMMVNTGGFNFLFTGDADSQMEENMIEMYGHLEMDVLKLAHHGSNTSTGERFIQNTDFSYAVISAGADNRYGHPHPEVIGRLKHARIFDTSEHGMVRFNIRGNEMCVETKLAPELDHCIKKELH
ncbi:DNA internalization-related competence protein ComEC/Rec2 [Salinicoccus carnicancri]|uniref:DNA internalization-related competence protein ComEC/Rec2 n=1 Tax=Salinicoccus carnicancri TaxID=558170 RepID=UPI001FE0A719|nr:DNA internalization-related competence protein ComEC/Rec2 [Salinicoccus carnicancri]